MVDAASKIRLRPILMTLLRDDLRRPPDRDRARQPGAESRRPLGIAVVGRAALLDLPDAALCVPVVYRLLARFTASRQLQPLPALAAEPARRARLMGNPGSDSRRRAP